MAAVSDGSALPCPAWRIGVATWGKVQHSRALRCNGSAGLGLAPHCKAMAWQWRCRAARSGASQRPGGAALGTAMALRSEAWQGAARASRGLAGRGDAMAVA